MVTSKNGRAVVSAKSEKVLFPTTTLLIKLVRLTRDDATPGEQVISSIRTHSPDISNNDRLEVDLSQKIVFTNNRESTDMPAKLAVSRVILIVFIDEEELTNSTRVRHTRFVGRRERWSS